MRREKPKEAIYLVKPSIAWQASRRLVPCWSRPVCSKRGIGITHLDRCKVPIPTTVLWKDSLGYKRRWVGIVSNELGVPTSMASMRGDLRRMTGSRSGSTSHPKKEVMKQMNAFNF